MTRWVSRLVCLVLGSLLGVGCNDHPTAVEYGVPHARYKVSGTVIARDTGAAIPGIRIFFARSGTPDSSTTAVSGVDGLWSLDITSFPCEDRCSLVAVDEDGPENGGAFAPGSAQLDHLIQTDPRDHWYSGTFEQHGIEVALDPESRKD